MRPIIKFLIAVILVVLLFEIVVLFRSRHSDSMGTGFVSYEKTAVGNFNLLFVSENDTTSVNMTEVCLIDNTAEDVNTSSCTFIDEFISSNCRDLDSRLCIVQDKYCCCPGHLFISDSNTSLVFFCDSPIDIVG